MRRNGIELLFQPVDAGAYAAAIGFKLCFTWAACANAATELGHGLAPSGEPWQLVLKLCELDLQVAFAGAGVAGKDVKNQLRAVDYTAGQFRVEVS